MARVPLQTKVSPEFSTLRHNADTNLNLVVSPPFRIGQIITKINAKSKRTPLEITFTEGLRTPQNKNPPNKLLWNDVFVCGTPCNCLTVVRFIQLLAVNILVLILPWISVVQEYLQELSTWTVMIVM